MVGAATSTRVGRRLGTGGAIWCANLTSAAGVVVMGEAALAPNGWPAAAVLALGQLGHGWSMGLSNSHEMTFRQALTPDELQARTNTTLRSLNRAVIVVVSPLAGLCADRFGFVAALAARYAGVDQRHAAVDHHQVCVHEVGDVHLEDAVDDLPHRVSVRAGAVVG